MKDAWNVIGYSTSQKAGHSGSHLAKLLLPVCKYCDVVGGIFTMTREDASNNTLMLNYFDTAAAESHIHRGASSERKFIQGGDQGGHIITKHRIRLCPDTVRYLYYLRSW